MLRARASALFKLRILRIPAGQAERALETLSHRFCWALPIIHTGAILSFQSIADPFKTDMFKNSTHFSHDSRYIWESAMTFPGGQHTVRFRRVADTSAT